MEIFTAGYEGETINQYIDKLRDAGITMLIDIREKAISRKKGFSKTALKDLLNENNIAYLHLRDLGSPTTIRKQLHEDKDYITFFEKYNEYLNQHESTLFEIISKIENERACFMCFEKNHRQCHRSAVVKKIEDIFPGKVRIEHI